MQHQITVLTVSSRIPSGGSGNEPFVPFSNGEPIIFDDPRLSTILVSDDDAQFNTGFYSINETDQRLVEPATFGHGSSAEVVPAGTQLSSFIATVVTEAKGDQFMMLFPRGFDPGEFGDEFGDRHSVLVFPLPTGPADQQVFPAFDPAGSYRFTRIYTPSVLSDGLPYAPAPPDPDVAPCFLRGSLIRTASGWRPVEALRTGDLVPTLDHGTQPVLWVGSRRLDAHALDLCPQNRPIRIAPGALGAGQPARPLIVSPQHRVLIRSRVARRIAGQPEVLVAAVHLIGLPGITVLRQPAPVTYWHVLFEGHELIEAEGAWAESLYPGPVALRALGPCAGSQIRTLLPRLAQGWLPTPARPFLPGSKARNLMRRHGRNARPLLEEV